MSLIINTCESKRTTVHSITHITLPIYAASLILRHPIASSSIIIIEIDLGLKWFLFDNICNALLHYNIYIQYKLAFTYHIYMCSI